MRNAASSSQRPVASSSRSKRIGLAGSQHAGIELDPTVGLRAHHLAHLLADDIGNAGVSGVGGIGLDVDVVAERAVRAVDEFDDAEAFIDRVEQRPVAPLALAQL